MAVVQGEATVALLQLGTVVHGPFRFVASSSVQLLHPQVRIKLGGFFTMVMQHGF